MAAGQKPKNGFKPGISGNPAGRKKGTVTKATMLERQAAEVARSGITPLQFMLTVMRGESGKLKEWGVTGPTLGIKTRMDAAKSAAPYVHRKMPIGVDGGDGKPIGFYSADLLAKLTDDEVERLAQNLEMLDRLRGGAPSAQQSAVGQAIAVAVQAASEDDEDDQS
jgi:hypothetical protein